MYNSTKLISGQVVIDNPIILEKLELNPENPITISGEYEVFQNDIYKYIVIDSSSNNPSSYE